MSDLIDREKAIQGVRELFSLGECYCDELSIVGMLNGLPSAEQERMAKVEDKYYDYLPYSRFMESELKGDCGFCGETVWLGEKYCHECGTKLDWSGND